MQRQVGVLGRMCLGAVNAKPKTNKEKKNTVLILKGLRNSLFWNHSE